MEFVFVVPRSELFPESCPHGLRLFGDGCLEEDFLSTVERKGFFVERAYAERTPTLKQIIPYSVVCRDDEVFLLRRTAQGGEVRLHNKLSLGVGGHINPRDLPNGARRNPIPAATHREVFEEELHIEQGYDVQTIGIINDDSNPVGAVHVGLVQKLSVEGTVKVRETDQLEGRFTSRAELFSLLDEGANFESWSSLLIPQLDRILTECVPH